MTTTTMTTPVKSYANWNNLPEEVQDSISWSISKRHWKFQPRNWAVAVYYDNERTMLNEAARHFGYGSLDDAISYG
jgi:hypothetical protein